MTLSTHITTPAASVAELERLKVLHKGQKEKLTSSDAEFERRLSGLRRIMAEKQLDAVVLITCHGIKCYSDPLCTTFCRNCVLVVTANVDAGTPWRTSYGENIVYTDWRRDNSYHGPREALRQRGVPHREIRDTWVWFQSGINTDGAHNRTQEPRRR